MHESNFIVAGGKNFDFPYDLTKPVIIKPRVAYILFMLFVHVLLFIVIFNPLSSQPPDLVEIIFLVLFALGILSSCAVLILALLGKFSLTLNEEGISFNYVFRKPHFVKWGEIHKFEYKKIKHRFNTFKYICLYKKHRNKTPLSIYSLYFKDGEKLTEELNRYSLLYDKDLKVELSDNFEEERKKDAHIIYLISTLIFIAMWIFMYWYYKVR